MVTVRTGVRLPSEMYTGVAQLVEHWSPKPGVRSSSLSSVLNGTLVMKIGTYFKESYNELVHKVTWPSWNELQSSATLVLITSVIPAIVIWAMDFFLTRSWVLYMVCYIKIHNGHR